MNTQSKTFTPVPDGDVTVRTMGGTTKTSGDTSRNSILDARWVEQSMAYGAFPRPAMDAPAEAPAKK